MLLFTVGFNDIDGLLPAMRVIGKEVAWVGSETSYEATMIYDKDKGVQAATLGSPMFTLKPSDLDWS
jgi:hypothetical protein